MLCALFFFICSYQPCLSSEHTPYRGIFSIAEGNQARALRDKMGCKRVSSDASRTFDEGRIVLDGGGGEVSGPRRLAMKKEKGLASPSGLFCTPIAESGLEWEAVSNGPPEEIVTNPHNYTPATMYPNEPIPLTTTPNYTHAPYTFKALHTQTQSF